MSLRSVSLLLALIPVLFACSSTQKIVSGKKDLAAQTSQLSQYDKQLDDLSAKIKQKEQQNEMDDTAATRIRKFIGASQAEIAKLKAQNDILLGQTTVDRGNWQDLKQQLRLSAKLAETMADRVEMISDLVNRNLVIKLDQDIIFESGKYLVSPDVAGKLETLFQPAADEINAFIKKYPDYPLSVVINANGFADATSIAEGTGLYKDIKARLKSGASGSKEMNREISRLRAEDVMNYFRKFFTARFSTGKHIRNIVYVFDGKGEEFPNPKISDYRMDDARRRVVLLYWSVFPE
jgi:outer membrane protein OmpA-like peptidoglycan-associated protein